jgi:hypothetical protein
MSTLPSLNVVLFNNGESEMHATQTNNGLRAINEVSVGLRAEEAASRVYSNREDIFTPLKVIGRIDLKGHLIQRPGYAWRPFKKDSYSTMNESQPDEQKNDKSEDKDVFFERNNKENADGRVETSGEGNAISIEGEEEDIIRDFQSKPWMQDPKANKSRPKSFPDKKLAIRSDVVNKTLLRSLKRYYTAEFEKTTLNTLSGKFTSKSEVYRTIKEFTENIYDGERRFNLDEFADVQLDELVFYMGICIKPQEMKKSTNSPQERQKFQNFYSCLYKYSHKKLLKLFHSNTLHFMFRKFFEDGIFDDLLINDATLKRNPEVYKNASENFLNLFKQNCK